MVNTIKEALKDSWIYKVGIPLVRFWADNGREFSKLKMDELTSKLGITIKFAPAYSSCRNGLNEHNYTYVYMNINKLLEIKKMSLNDF